MTPNQQMERRVADLILRYRTAGPFEAQPFIPGEERLEELLSAARSISLELLSQGDGLLRSHWLEVLESFTARVEEDRRFPFRFISGLSGALTDLLFEDPRPQTERLAPLIARLEAAPRVIAEAGAMTASLTAERRAQVKRGLDGLLRVLLRTEGALAGWAGDQGQIAEGLTAVRESALALKADLKGLIPDGSLPDLAYERVIGEIFGGSLAETLRWTDDEVARCEQEYRALAARLAPGVEPREILARELPHAPSPAAMFAEMAGYVETARKACLELISLPQGELCEIAEVPDQIKDSYPWGGYRGGNILRGSLSGKVFLNQHNYTAVSRGWMQMMALHECYPGHHAQRVKATASALPLTFKVGLSMTRDSHLTEGIAHRSEKLLEHIFPDRAFPLFVAYRRLHTAVRVRADIDLHYHRRGTEAAAALYRQYLGFTDAEAMGQVRFQEQWPGYMTTYYTGMRELERLEATQPLPAREWNELLFSAGFVSLKSLERLLALPADRRTAILEGRSLD